jgi:hypothetical protein
VPEIVAREPLGGSVVVCGITPHKTGQHQLRVQENSVEEVIT